MWMQINQFWVSLESREQSLIKLLSLFLALVLIYLVIWSPLQTSKNQAMQQLNAAQQEWTWLNQQIPAVESMRSSQGVQKVINSQSSLMTIIQSSLKQQNLFKDIETINGATNGGKVTFKQVNSSRLFKWLFLIEDQGVKITKLNIKKMSNGLVQASAQLNYK